MNIAAFLEVNGALNGGNDERQWFRLPERHGSRTSLRFGAHTFAWDAKTMRILPVANHVLNLTGPQRTADLPAATAPAACLRGGRLFGILADRRRQWLSFLG